VLIVEDEFESQLLYEKTFKHSRFQVIAARSIVEANAVLAKVTPAAIVLDILLGEGDSWDFLVDLRQSPVHGRIPVVIVSTLNDIQKGLALGAEACGVKPIDRAWLLSTLETLTGAARSLCRVLIIEDQPAMRYVLTQLIDPAHHVIEEAATGADGLASARVSSPDVILLDLGLPDMGGATVLRELKTDPATRRVPVVVVTGSRLEGPDLELVRGAAADIVNKDALTRERIAQALRLCAPLSSAEAVHD
jgi:CheY-like chemotaxis protein